jgi:FkbM family methyltransferase
MDGGESIAEPHAIRIMTALRSRLPAEPVVFDVGASNGCWAWQAARVWPAARLHLFEPNWAIGDAYKDDILKPLLASSYDVTLHAVALGDKDGVVTMHMTPDNVSSTTLEWEGAAGRSKPVAVPMTSIDATVANGAPQPHLIKLDIQGGELLALKGATHSLRSVKAVMLEAWLQRSYGVKTPLLHEIAALLYSYGLRLSDFGDEFRLSDGALYSVDVCFVRD